MDIELQDMPFNVLKTKLMTNVDPTRSTGSRNSLLKINKMKKVSEFWENLSLGGTVCLELPLTFYFYL